MTASRDPDHLIHHFLLEGEERLQDQVYDAVRAEIDQRRQRVVIGPWRLPEMNKIVTVGLGAAAVVVAVFVGAQLFGSPSGGVGGDGPPTQGQDEVEFDVALHYYGVSGNLIRIPEPQPTRVRAQLPDGWVANESAMTMDSDEAEHSLAISFWAVDAVFTEPCTNESRADPPMMQTLDGLAEALTGWWQGDAAGQPSTTQPVPTTVSGFRAQYLEVRVPDNVDTDACFRGRYATWRNADGVERHHQPGDVSRIWIVEVGPPPRLHPAPSGLEPCCPSEPSTPLLVIDATSNGEASSETLRKLDELIDSVRIEAPEGLP